MFEVFFCDTLKNKIDTLFIHKNDFKKTYNAHDIYNFKGFSIEKQYLPLVINEYKFIDYPILVPGDVFYREGKFVAEFKNIGVDCEFVEVKPVDNNRNNLKLNNDFLNKINKQGGNILISGTYSGVEPNLEANLFYKVNNIKKDTTLLLNFIGTSCYIHN